jgi:hypothetical protein
MPNGREAFSLGLRRRVCDKQPRPARPAKRDESWKEDRWLSPSVAGYCGGRAATRP